MEIWAAIPRNIHIKYRPKVDEYPIKETFTLKMPPAYDPSSISHDISKGFPTRVSILQGFHVQYRSGAENSHASEHWLREVFVVVENDGWNSVTDVHGKMISQGPDVKITVGLRDNSGGDPPDDGFNAEVHVSALVVY